MILPEPSTSKNSKADFDSSSVTSTPPREFLGTRSGAFFGPSSERRGMVVVLPHLWDCLVRGGAESNCCASQQWLFGGRGRVEPCVAVGRGGSPFSTVRRWSRRWLLAEVGSSAPPPRRMVRGTQTMSAPLPTAGSFKGERNALASRQSNWLCTL